MADKEEKLEKARKRAKLKMDFYRHLGTFTVVIIVLAIINNVTTPGGYQWWIWPLIGWGIGIVSHFTSVFVTSSNLEKKLVEKELEKMDDEE